eukprot:2445397-Prymnesium_polylepis.3
MMKKVGLPDPGSPNTPLPTILPCGARYQANAAMGPDGIVYGDTWERFQRAGFLAQHGHGGEA